MITTPRDCPRIRYQVRVAVAGSGGLDCLHSRPPTLILWVADVVDGNIRVRRAEMGVPPYDFTAFATASGTASHPSLTENTDHRLYLLYQEGAGDVRETWSDDDGEIWSASVMALPNGKYPLARTQPLPHGHRLDAAYVSGLIYGRLTSAGDDVDTFTFSYPSGSPLLVEDAPFSYSWHPDDREQVFGLFQLLGAAGATDWVSDDDGRTWLPA